jgi:hypothetical protein
VNASGESRQQVPPPIYLGRLWSWGADGDLNQSGRAVIIYSQGLDVGRWPIVESNVSRMFLGRQYRVFPSLIPESPAKFPDAGFGDDIRGPTQRMGS